MNGDQEEVLAQEEELEIWQMERLYEDEEGPSRGYVDQD